jgi:hypothetical protein
MRAAFLAPLLLSLSACAADTEGERVSFQLMATASGADAPFATASGWTIDIQQAEVVLGPVFLFDAEPIARAPWSSWLVSEAHAHVPTQAGAVLGEAIDQVRLDLLASTPAFLADVYGQAGVARSLELQLFRAGEVNTTVTGDTVVLAGQAQRDGVTVPFEFRWSPDEGAPVSITNIAASLDLNSSGARVQLSLDLPSVFYNVDLTATESMTDVMVIETGSEAGQAIASGLASRWSWSAEVMP